MAPKSRLVSTLVLVLAAASLLGCPRPAPRPGLALVAGAQGLDLEAGLPGALPVPVVLAPGTSGLQLTGSPGFLVWSTPGGSASTLVRLDEVAGAILLDSEGVSIQALKDSLSQAALLVLPTGSVFGVDPTRTPMLEIVRWEGALPDGRPCVLEVFHSQPN